MNMNIEEVAKNLKTLQLCVDINSNVFESRACMDRLQKTTDEGLIAAYKLVKFSMQMKDPKLMGVVYKRTQDLFPDESKMDSVKMFEVNELKKTFERGYKKYILGKRRKKGGVKKLNLCKVQAKSVCWNKEEIT